MLPAIMVVLLLGVSAPPEGRFLVSSFWFLESPETKNQGSQNQKPETPLVLYRSLAVRREFQRRHPCPANGARRGPCPGWVVDHRLPLCAGGKDQLSNLRWQRRARALGKDKIEWQFCRMVRP